MLNALWTSMFPVLVTAICAGLIHPSNPNWRSEVRREFLDDDLQKTRQMMKTMIRD